MVRQLEKRAKPRIKKVERLFLRIESSPDDLDTVGKTIKCTTLDLSATGLKLKVEKDIQQGAKVELWIGLTPHKAKLLLQGEVMWSKELNDAHLVGIQLQESEITNDLKVWEDILDTESHPMHRMET